MKVWIEGRFPGVLDSNQREHGGLVCEGSEEINAALSGGTRRLSDGFLMRNRCRIEGRGSKSLTASSSSSSQCGAGRC